MNLQQQEQAISLLNDYLDIPKGNTPEYKERRQQYFYKVEEFLKSVKEQENLNPKLHAIKIVHMIDHEPDLSYLDQFENSEKEDEQKCYEQDQKRLEDYNNGKWWMIGIKVVATIFIPFKTVSNKGEHINHKIETIESSGLWSIESDSGDDYFKEVAADQLEELKGYLEQFGIDPSEATLPDTPKTM